MRPSLSPALLPLALLACNGPGGGDDDPNGSKDTDPQYEEGCILVDGGGGYAWLADALEVADDGSEITLCEGNLELSITIDRSVTLVGHGIGETTWSAPVNQVPLTVEGATVTLRDLSFASTRSAIRAEGAVLTVEDVAILDVGNYGIDARGSQVTARRVLVEGAGYGAIRVEGGALHLEDSELIENEAFGVRLQGGAEGTLVGNEIGLTLYTGNSGFLWEADGAAVWVDNAEAHLTDNLLFANQISALQADNATITMNGDVAAGENYAFTGVLLQNTSAHLEGVDIDRAFRYSLLSIASPPVTLIDVDVVADPALSAQPTYTVEADGSVSVVEGSTGVFVQDTDLVMQGGRVEGHATGGIFAFANTSASVEAALDGVEILDNGNFGIFFRDGTLELTDVVVADTWLHEPLCWDVYGVCNTGVVAWDANTTWHGGEIRDNHEWGLLSAFGFLEMRDAEVSANEVLGVYAFNSAFDVRGASFFDNRVAAGLYMVDSNGLVEEVTFHDTAWQSRSVFTDGSSSLSHYAGRDAYQAGGSVVVRESTFASGDWGYYAASDAEVLLEDVSFADYARTPLYAFMADVTLTGVTFQDIRANAVYCSSGSLKADGVQIREVGPQHTLVEYFDAEGEPTSSFSNTTSTSGMALHGCQVELRDLLLEDTTMRAIHANNSDLVLDGLAVRDANRDGSTVEGAINLTWSSGEPYLWLHDLEVTGVGRGHGVRVSSSPSLEAGWVELADLRIGQPFEGHEGVAGDGLHLNALQGVKVEGLDVHGTGQAGVHLVASSGEVVGAAMGRTGTLSGAGTHGLLAVGSELVASDLHVIQPTQAGFMVSGGQAAFSSNTVTEAGTWGLDCLDAQLDTCDDPANLDGTEGSVAETCDCP